MAHPFFDELRDPSSLLPNGTTRLSLLSLDLSISAWHPLPSWLDTAQKWPFSLYIYTWTYLPLLTYPANLLLMIKLESVDAAA